MRSIGVLKGHAVPTAALKRKIGAMYGESKVIDIQKALDDLVTVDALSLVLTEGINSVTRTDGRLDTKDLAAFVLQRMKEHQK
jgi:hypothetical protein